MHSDVAVLVVVAFVVLVVVDFVVDFAFHVVVTGADANGVVLPVTGAFDVAVDVAVVVGIQPFAVAGAVTVVVV